MEPNAELDKAGYWQVDRDISEGRALEPVWACAELCHTMEEAHERARKRASMGQKTRVVPKFDGVLLKLCPMHGTHPGDPISPGVTCNGESLACPGKSGTGGPGRGQDRLNT